MGCYEILWDAPSWLRILFEGFFGILLAYFKVLWDSFGGFFEDPLGCYEILWDALGFFEIPWDSLGFSWIL